MPKKRHGIKTVAMLALACLAGCAPKSDQVIVYSARAEQLIAPLFERYMAETGETVTWATDKE